MYGSNEKTPATVKWKSWRYLHKTHRWCTSYPPLLSHHLPLGRATYALVLTNQHTPNLDASMETVQKSCDTHFLRRPTTTTTLHISLRSPINHAILSSLHQHPTPNMSTIEEFEAEACGRVTRIQGIHTESTEELSNIRLDKNASALRPQNIEAGLDTAVYLSQSNQTLLTDSQRTLAFSYDGARILSYSLSYVAGDSTESHILTLASGTMILYQGVLLDPQFLWHSSHLPSEQPNVTCGSFATRCNESKYISYMRRRVTQPEAVLSEL